MGAARYRDFADGFRADAGFVPRVGYREGRAAGGWAFFADGLVTAFRPQAEATYAEDRDGRVLAREYSAGFFLAGRRNLTAFANLDFETERTGEKLLSTTNGNLAVQVDPSRAVTRVGFEVQLGESIDLANEQVGTGGEVTAFATLRPHPRVTLDLQGARRWLDVPRPGGGDGRLFTSSVFRTRALVHFSSRAYLRLVGQWVGTTSDPALYPYTVDPKEGGFEGSALFTYKVNWQTALYVGYGDERALDERDELHHTSRQLFAKVSYAFQK